MTSFNNINFNNNSISPLLQKRLKEQVKAPNNPFLINNQADSVELGNTKTEDVTSLEKDFKKTKSEQGLVGKAWDGIKNFLHFKSGSAYVEKSIKDFNNGKITKEQAQEILEKYQDGQNVCVDTVADIASSIAAVGVFSLATGGLGLPVALGLSFLTGAGVKTAGKAFGAKANGREYDTKNLLYDVATGGVNGLLAPVTNGLGSNLTKTIGSKLGLEIIGDAVENTGKAAVKSSLKSILLNQSIDVTGGTMGKRAIALGAGMALDGALGGTADNATRAALDGKDAKGVAQAGLQGFLGGLIMSPIIGGGFRMAGKAGKSLSQKIFKNNTPDAPTSAQPSNTTNTGAGNEADVSIKPHGDGSDTPTPAVDADADATVTSKTPKDATDVNSGADAKPANIDTSDNAVNADVDVAANKIKRNVVACLQPIEVQQARFDELTKINSSKNKYDRLSDEFIERASKEFSPERYELLLKFASSTDEFDRFSYRSIPDILDNCDDKTAKILTDLFSMKTYASYSRIGINDCKAALELDDIHLECLKDVLTGQTKDHYFIPSDVINSIKELTDEQLPIFRELSHIDGVDGFCQFKPNEVKEIAQSMPVENLENIRRCLDKLKDNKTSVKPKDVVEKFSKCPKEKAAQLESTYKFLMSNAASRVHSSDLGNFLDEATEKEFELAKKLLALTNDEGQFVIDGYYDQETLSRESLLKLFFEKHSEARYSLIDEFSKYPQSKNSREIAYILKYLDDDQADFVKRNLVIDGRNEQEQFYNTPMCNLSRIKKEDIEFIEKNNLLYLSERGEQFDWGDLPEVAKLGEDGLKTAKERGLFTMKQPGKEHYLSGQDIYDLAQIEDKNWAKAQEVFDIISKNSKLQGLGGYSSSDAVKLAQLSDADFEKAKKFILLEEREHPFSTDSVIELTKLDSKAIDIAKQRNLLTDLGYGGYDIAELVSLSDADFERIKPMMSLGRAFNGYSLKEFATLTDDELQRAQSIAYIPERKEYISGVSQLFNTDEIIELAKLSKEQFDNIQPFMGHNEGRISLFTRQDIMKLTTLSGKELKTAQDFITVPGRDFYNQFNADDIVALSKLSPKELERARKYFYIEELGYNQLDGKVIALIQKYEGVKSFESLTIRQKRELLNTLVKENSSLFGPNYSEIANCGVLPKNKDEYCALLPKLVKAIGISTNELSDDVKAGFYKTMSSIEAPNSKFRTFDFENPNFKLDLTYSRKQFVSDMADILAPLSKEERNTVCNYFGFELISKDGRYFMNGYPVNLNNGAELAQIDNPHLKQIIEKMRPLVKNFSENNTVKIKGEPELSDELNNIIKAFPEFITEIGRKQHHTHDYTLDVHSLKVLQGVVNNPKYDNLPENDKTALKIAALLHDITKQENLRDHTHPQESAYDVYYLLQKLNLSEDEKLKIYQIIKDHNWLQRYNATELVNGKRVPISAQQRTKVAKDIAFDLRKGNSFEMASILTEADMQAVERGGEFFEGLQGILEQSENEVGSFVKQIKESAIHLPQTKIPKASEIKVDGDKVKDVVTTLADGSKVTNRVIYLEPNMDLSKYGFAEGLNSDDLNVLIHALDNDKQSAIFQALGQVDSDALLSSSYVNYGQGNFHAFRHQGFVLDVDSDDINAGYYRDFGSGYEKTLEILKSSYLFNGNDKEYRNFISEQLKEILKLSDLQYAELYDKIKNKSISELDNEYPNVAKAMRELFTKMEGGKRQGGRKYNEMLVTRPKIQAVFDYGKSSDISSIPDFLREYAAENNIPVIYFGK